MIKLSSRLKLMADQIEQNETMADIGTDHGFLPMYLIDKAVCQKVILADVSKGSLEKAKSNVKALIEKRANEGKVLTSDSFDFRLGDGISVLDEGEADTIVIAGMGGVLISEILERGLSVAHATKRLVLQPRNGQAKLRFWLLRHGFVIEKELLVREGKFLCEIITAVSKTGSPLLIPEEELPAPASALCYEIPESLLENGTIAEEYMKRRIAMKERILKELSKTKTLPEEMLLERQEKIFREIAYCRELLAKCKPFSDVNEKNREEC